MASTAGLRWGLDAYTSRRFTVSAHAVDSPVLPNTAFRRWFDEHRRANQFTVHRIPFDELVGWRFEDGTGNLVHDSGKFFSVEGLDVHTDWGDRGAWMQPIINQPEIGILGIVVKEFDGILHCLMQAKMEPGNLDSVQLSPTVQATRSNYTGVHRGRSIRYLEYFLPPRRGDVSASVVYRAGLPAASPRAFRAPPACFAITSISLSGSNDSTLTATMPLVDSLNRALSGVSAVMTAWALPASSSHRPNNSTPAPARRRMVPCAEAHRWHNQDDAGILYQRRGRSEGGVVDDRDAADGDGCQVLL